MSFADQQWCPTSAQVTVLQARGLRIKGKSGTNDAYAVMQVGKEKYQTSVAEKSVAPVWREEATFDLPQGGGGGGGKGTLHVHVLHRALVGPDKQLGQAVVDLLRLSEDKTRNKTEWFKLVDKTGKADKDRGEVLLDIQFMRNHMTASMFDLSAAGKSRSRLGKFKDKVRGKKKEPDAVSGVVPSFTQVLTDSEEEAHDEGAAGKDEKKKKHKMKSLFSAKSNLQRNMSQSMSVLPAKTSSLSRSQSSGLNVDSSEGKKKFKFMIHKRLSSSDGKDSSGQTKHGGVGEQSNLCINGSHVYCDGSNFSLTSSGHGSMEDVPESSPPSVSSLNAARQYSPWTEEEEEEKEEEEEETAEVENIMEDVDEERISMEKRREEEVNRTKEDRVRREEEERERLAVEKRRMEEQERQKLEDEEERRRLEEQQLAEEKRRKEEEKRAEEEKMRREEEERLFREEERMRQEEERERERLAEQKRRLEEQERKRIEEEMQREEEERIRMDEERRQEEERERERLEEEKRLEEQERKRIEEERIRVGEEKRQKEHQLAEENRQMKKRAEEEERVRRLEEEEREMKRILDEQERRWQEEQEKNRKEEEKRLEEEERARKEKEEYERFVREVKEKERIEAEEKIKKEVEDRIKMEEEVKREEEKKRLEEQERRRIEEEERRRREEEEGRRREEEERRREEEERRREEEDRVKKEKEELERLAEEKRRAEEQESRWKEEERFREEEQEKVRMEAERKRRREEEEMERLAEEKRRREEQEKLRTEEEEIQREEKQRFGRVEEEEEEEEARKLMNKRNEEQKNQSKVTSTNPFDENVPPEDVPRSPTEADVGCQSAVSLVEGKSVSTDDKNVVNAQREKRHAPPPPGRNIAASRKEQDVASQHLVQNNKQSNDKDVKTASVLPQRSLLLIAPQSQSRTDAKITQNLAQSTASGGKCSKRPAPSRPGAAEEEPSSASVRGLSSNGKTSQGGGSKRKLAPVVRGLNPFEDDEDELTLQDHTTNPGDTSPILWPPPLSQATAEAKPKSSSKTSHAPPPPASIRANASTLIHQNSDGCRVTTTPAVSAPDNDAIRACGPQPEATLSVQNTSVKDPQPAEVTGVKKEAPPTSSRRLLPVRPLNPLEQQSVSIGQEGKSDKSTGILSDIQEKTKITDDSGLKGPYSQLTREELVSLVLKQENQMSERDKKISELEQYIDNLLVRVIEEQPSILMSMNSLK